MEQDEMIDAIETILEMEADKTTEKRKTAVRVRVSKIFKKAEEDGTLPGTPKEKAAFFYNLFYSIKEDDVKEAIEKRLLKGLTTSQESEFRGWGKVSETLSVYRPTLIAAQEAVLRSAAEYNLVASRIDSRIWESIRLTDLFKEIVKRTSATMEELNSLPFQTLRIIREGKRVTNHLFTYNPNTGQVNALTDKEDALLDKARKEYIDSVAEAKGIINALYEFLQFINANEFLTDEIKEIIKSVEHYSQEYNFHYKGGMYNLPLYKYVEAEDYSGNANPFINYIITLNQK